MYKLFQVNLDDCCFKAIINKCISSIFDKLVFYIVLLVMFLPGFTVISQSESTGINNKQLAVGGNLPYKGSGGDKRKGNGNGGGKDEGEIVIPDYEYPPYNGPKKTVAVAKFDATGSFLAKYGGWDVGGGLSAQLVDELVRSNRFIVVDRSDLSAVLREQELKLEGLTNKSAPTAGRLLGAQKIIRGSVTEFNEDDKGKGFRIGIGSRGVGTSVAPKSRKGHVKIIVRMINSETGQVEGSYNAEQELVAKAIAIDVIKDNLSFGGESFKKTALGQATQLAMRDIVQYIIKEMENEPWQALVANVKGGKVYINAGNNANLKVGDTLKCYRTVDQVIDPASGEVLGVEQAQIGTVRINQVFPKYSTAMFSGQYTPRRGDVLKF